MSGYSVRQLLKWTLDDALIESYSIDKKGDYDIQMHGETIHLPPAEARKLLVALLRGSGNRPTSDEGS